MARALTLQGTKRLTIYACRLLGGLAGDVGEEAKDLVMEAVRKAITGERCWDREKTPDPIDFLFSIIRSLASSRRKTEARKPPPRMSAEYVEEIGVLKPSQPELEDRIDGERFIDDLIGELGGDRVCERMVELIVWEGCSPAEIAARLELPATEIYTARKRLKGKIEALKKRQVK